jgi:hypothetical protein
VENFSENRLNNYPAASRHPRQELSHPVAEAEAKAISERTKAALRAARL